MSERPGRLRGRERRVGAAGATIDVLNGAHRFGSRNDPTRVDLNDPTNDPTRVDLSLWNQTTPPGLT